MEETKEARIGRYLAGEMTGREREDFEREVALDPGFKASVSALERIWRHKAEFISENWDVDSAWSRFPLSDIHQNQPVFKSKRRVLAWSIAATLLLLVGTYALFFNQGTPVTYAFDAGKTEPVRLKDGSKIYLNKASSVTVYPFTGKKRHVELKGEAFFEIAPDQKRPFTITTGQTNTEVVGTSFNIRQTLGQTQIFVNTGKIIFSSLKDSQLAVALTAGEAAVFEGEKMEMIPNPSPNINAWRTHQLRFIKMPLSTVIADVSAYFDEQITIESESIKSCMINIPLSFKKPEIGSVLSAVAESINAKMVKEGDTYIIRGGRICP